MPRSLVRAGAAASGLLLLLSACSPTLDWREVRPEDSGAVALFPCKPSIDSRMVQLGGARVRMSLAACRAGELTWALAYADVGDLARVAPALKELRAAASGNLAGTAGITRPLQVPGMTPQPEAQRVRIEGKRPSGEGAQVLEAGFFSRGTRVYQASVMGAALDAEAVGTFFAALKLQT
jgi:hypothetical protein